MFQVAVISFFYFFSLLLLLLLPLETHSLAPGQSGGVLLFDVMLQRSPDGDISFHPVHMHLVPVKTTYDFMASFFSSSSFSSFT